MYGNTDRGQVEVVEEHRHVVVQAFGCREMKLEDPLADTL